MTYRIRIYICVWKINRSIVLFDLVTFLFFKCDNLSFKNLRNLPSYLELGIIHPLIKISIYQLSAIYIFHRLPGRLIETSISNTVLGIVQVSPNDIFRIDKNEVSAETMVQHEQREEEVNQETVDHDKQFSVLKGKVNSTPLELRSSSGSTVWVITC